MDRRCFLIAAALIAMTSTGCGSKSTPVGTGQQWVENVPTPDLTLREFLEAVRTGDDAKAEQLLTDVAREETQKYDLSVAPPGSDTAKFEVGKVEYIAANEVAHVISTWTDVGDDGQPQSDEIIWMLRRDPAGWRIAGMATKIFPDELPLLLDFEDPQDMIRKQRLAEAEMKRRAAGGAATTAGGPAPTGPAAPTGPTGPTAPGVTPGNRTATAPAPGQTPAGVRPSNPLNTPSPSQAEKPGQRNVLRQ
jgi:hypothetical protein